MIRDAIKKVVKKESLTKEEAMQVMQLIMEGKATEAQIGSFLTALRMKGETPAEIAGCALVMREKAEKIIINKSPLIDTCGTGGDGVGSFNVSTAAAFTVAGMGLNVAKHGNRAISSKCGSADVLEALGIRINLTPNATAKIIEKIGIGFLFAPVYHQAMRHCALPRRQIGIRSIFNILGPLTNPVGAEYQIIGVFDPNLTECIAKVLDIVGAKSAFVVNGAGGLDEISIMGPSKITHLHEGNIRTFEINPEDFGFQRRGIEEIKGGNPLYNAKVIVKILQGEKGAAREIVALNAGAAAFVAGLTENIKDGVRMALDSIDSGKAFLKLEALKDLTNNPLEEDAR